MILPSASNNVNGLCKSARAFQSSEPHHPNLLSDCPYPQTFSHLREKEAFASPIPKLGEWLGIKWGGFGRRYLGDKGRLIR
jgi:hypothetical protein